jgi:hypothetical protein
MDERKLMGAKWMAVMTLVSALLVLLKACTLTNGSLLPPCQP